MRTFDATPSKLRLGSSPSGESAASVLVSASAFPSFGDGGSRDPQPTSFSFQLASIAFPIILSKGKVAWIDPADYGRVSRLKWSYTRAQSGNEYAVRWVC